VQYLLWILAEAEENFVEEKRGVVDRLHLQGKGHAKLHVYKMYVLGVFLSQL